MNYLYDNKIDLSKNYAIINNPKSDCFFWGNKEEEYGQRKAEESTCVSGNRRN